MQHALCVHSCHLSLTLLWKGEKVKFHVLKKILAQISLPVKTDADRKKKRPLNVDCHCLCLQPLLMNSFIGYKTNRIQMCLTKSSGGDHCFISRTFWTPALTVNAHLELDLLVMTRQMTNFTMVSHWCICLSLYVQGGTLGKLTFLVTRNMDQDFSFICSLDTGVSRSPWPLLSGTSHQKPKKCL